MQNLFAQIGVVQRTDEGVLLALVVKRDVFVIDGARDGVPIMHSPTMFVWVEGPTAAYVESMERLGLLTAVVFDFGEDAYRAATAFGLWSAKPDEQLLDRGKPIALSEDVPF